MSGDNFGLQTASGHLNVPQESKEEYPADVLAQLTTDAETIIARYPQRRSALLPMLHLVQSVDGYVTGRGVRFCADLLDLTEAEVSGVATFYTQYKRHPNGEYTVGVCTNTLCAIMGGDEIWDAVSEHLGIGHDETTPDGKVTLERIECNAACDYAPVVMANWEFFDNQTPSSTTQLVDDLRAGVPVAPSRGPKSLCTFKQTSRVLAGFLDGLADEGVGAGPASLVGLELAHENGWAAPEGPNRLLAAAETLFATPPTPQAEKAAALAASKEASQAAPDSVEAVIANRAGGIVATGAAAAGGKAGADRGTYADGGHGEGSAKPGADGSGPEGWLIKGNENSMLFHTPDSPWHGRTIAEVWFRDIESAIAAGFKDARDRARKRNDGASGGAAAGSDTNGSDANRSDKEQA